MESMAAIEKPVRMILAVAVGTVKSVRTCERLAHDFTY